MIPVDLPPEPVAALVAHVEARCREVAEVRVDSLGIAADKLVEGSGYAWEGDPCRPAPTLRLREYGTERAWYVKPSYSVLVHTPVATEGVRAGQEVPYEMGVADLRHVRGTPVGQGTWRARTTVAAGTPITLSLVTPLPDAARGAPIALVVTRGKLRIEADGELLNDARVGEPVRALNHATRATVRGILVQPDVVEVQ